MPRTPRSKPQTHPDLRDALGRPVKVGDTVLFPGQPRHLLKAPELLVGEVVEIGEGRVTGRLTVLLRPPRPEAAREGDLRWGRDFLVRRGGESITLVYPGEITSTTAHRRPE